ncbi:hypothetical protein C9J48_05710 [Photobacterium profundum]|nr:hypothetical protein [Photobacterium profundum]PSV63669.1 hypothetical protein C9J48_05710 [Photobacterium profundum]
MVWLVIVVCLGQRAGFISSCPMSADNRSSETSIINEKTASSKWGATANTSDSNIDGATDKQCDMTDHLLQVHQHSFEHALIFISLLIVVLAWLSTMQYRIPVLTEPIPPTRRLHLTLCVFRE